MKKQTQTLIGIAVVGVIAYFVIRRMGKKDGMFKNAAGDEPRRVVGGYNAQTDQTYIFTYGNMGEGYYVKGRVNAPRGTIFQ